MLRIDLHRFSRRSSALVASTILALGAGCAAEAATTPTYVEGATVASGTGSADVEVVYVQQPPVMDIETYPSVVYEGVPVYFVGGEWYRRDERGWGYFRQEPPGLGQQRESHDRDPQWQRAREAPRHDQVQAARPEVARPEQVARPQQVEQAPRPETAHPEQVAPQARPVAAEPRPAEGNAAPVVVAPAQKKEETPVPAAPRRGRAPVRRGPPVPERR